MEVGVNLGERLGCFQHDARNVRAALVNQFLGYLQEPETLLLVYLRQRLRAGVEEALDLAPAGFDQRGRQRYERGLVLAYQREYLGSEREALRCQVVRPVGERIQERNETLQFRERQAVHQRGAVGEELAGQRAGLPGSLVQAAA